MTIAIFGNAIYETGCHSIATVAPSNGAPNVAFSPALWRLLRGGKPGWSG
jgi:hypothetical protein